MTFTVIKLDANRWQLTSPYGDNLAVYPTCKAAKNCGRLLAGWAGRVVVAR